MSNTNEKDNKTEYEFVPLVTCDGSYLVDCNGNVLVTCILENEINIKES